MSFVRRYLLPRLITYFLVVFVGLTIVFFLPRFLPSDPIQAYIDRLITQGGNLNPEYFNKLVETIKELYGLQGSLWNQYVNFWKRLLKGDFGPSYFQFPTPVMKLIRQSLPWTAWLLFVTTVISWIIGNILGGLAGYFSDKKWVKILDGIAMVIRPMPYYILALGLLILLAYIFPIFPIGGGFAIGMKFTFSWENLLILLKHAFLPALSLVLIGVFSWFQAMKLVVQSVKTEDYVKYAKMGGVEERRIVRRYVIRNAMLPQITGLALSLGQIFGGALITEIVFSYPGIGSLLYNAIFTGDYNLLMGISTLSILLVTTSILVIDLLYPLFDPRVRYR
ncbi:ABC transporter permease [Thermotoga maritima MSB8]|uniref:Oligopeptide ABC transporter, permease protein n=1 Tax=Thermotoga maritima (strain ATCC 43589 / DSM 3109 / JCM 10099 / NBRC 100826 / MSB8) TaxID=243274 RepID=Q9WXS7_THEMA|nr:ABC transporter permease [Thermotoga maritima]AAD35166.1 oligopeptide ABC transporter, permease protein [Thermotoga maritima MSB8]AGL48995.1 Xylobiose ABC transport system, permease protein 1 [Thermotoga maritima MSB8]AHD18158.1 ABC transporter permease [Thermotoga maritima MSB8]AKE26018.1 ABC transporter permease [Thermotoga maritima]AKE27880.1 ABC transporter permease [Thermotoga maritima MSB8]